MRISTANAYDATLEALMQRQTQLAATQQQISTNKRVNVASDDPTAAARAERAGARLLSNAASQRAVDASQNAMTLTDSSLGNASDLLQTAREAMVAAGNGTYSASDRKALADQLSAARDQLLAVANTTDGAGQFLFGGQGASIQPFADTTAGVKYSGGSGQTQVASGNALPISVDGAATWMQAPTGNGVFATSATTSTGTAWIDRGSVTDPSKITGSDYSLQFSVSGGQTTYSVTKDGAATAQSNVAYSAGSAITVDGMSFTISGQPANGDAFAVDKSTASLSVFDTLDKAIAGLKKGTMTSGQLTQLTSGTIGDIDQVAARLQSVRGQVGATLNRADNTTNRLTDATLHDKTDQSNAQDLDLAAALSSVSTQNTNYQAALQAYASVSKLSLFNYING